MSTLREQMLAELQLRGLTPKTQKIYLREVSNYAKYFNKSPEELGEKKLREYLLYLLNERKLAKGTYRFYYQGLKFLYKHTLKREEVVEKIRCPQGKKKLPVVLDLSEVKTLLTAMENLKHWAILMITYSAGLRISETARLKVSDIDSKRMMVRVQQGKGGKDRYTILSIQVVKDNLSGYVELLRNHIFKEDNILFPAADEMFTQDDQDALTEIFEKIEAEEIGEDVHEKYHQISHDLVNK